MLGLWKMCQGIEAFSLLTAQSLVNGLQTKKSVLIVKAENYYSQRTHTTQSENTELLQQRHQVSGGGNKRKRLPWEGEPLWVMSQGSPPEGGKSKAVPKNKKA